MSVLRKVAWSLARVDSLLAQPRLIPAVVRGARISLFEKLRSKYLLNYGITQIIDIGANEGQYGATLRAAYPEAEIHSFEPLPGACAKLRARAARHRRWHVHQIALGAIHAEMQMQENQFSPSSSLLPLSHEHRSVFPFAAATHPVRVQVRRLDEEAPAVGLNPQAPTMIKIDVQGYEDRVISGGGRTIAAARVLIVETSFIRLYEGQCLFADVQRLLDGLGFEYRGNLSQECSPADGSVLFSDSIFCRRDG